MSQPIPTTNKPRTLSFPSGSGFAKIDSNSALLTPNGTPPHTAGIPQSHFKDIHHHEQIESRLHQFLANFESGTHSFDREARETPEERRMSVGNASDVFPTPPSSRRPSFLSSLSLSRPFGFTSTTTSGTSSPISSTPLSGSHGKDFSHFQMTPASSSNGRPPLDKGHAAQSTPNVPLQAHGGNYEKEEGNLPNLNRSSTTPQLKTTQKQNGFVNSKLPKSELNVHVEGRRHFDPSREPKLLGLL